MFAAAAHENVLDAIDVGDLVGTYSAAQTPFKISSGRLKFGFHCRAGSGLEDDPAGDSVGGLRAERLGCRRERRHRAGLGAQVPLIGQSAELGQLSVAGLLVEDDPPERGQAKAPFRQNEGRPGHGRKPEVRVNRRGDKRPAGPVARHPRRRPR